MLELGAWNFSWFPPSTFMNVELVNTGSELMLGRVLNTHQQWLCRRLADLGHVVTRQVAIADAALDIREAVREALSRADLVITTGGLGPTSDDLTRELIAKLLGKKLVENKTVLAHIEKFFAKRNRPRPAKTSVETFVPEGAMVCLNQNGTAPGLAMKIEPFHFGSEKPSHLREQKFPRWFLPDASGCVLQKTFRCARGRSCFRPVFCRA